MKNPEKTIAYNVYLDGGALAGLATVELPKPELMTDTLSGAGIAGEIESAALGQVKSMQVKLSFRSKTADFIKLLAPTMHELDLRASVQVSDSAAGTIGSKPERILLRGQPKSPDLGKWEVAKAQDASLDLEVSYLNVFINGTSVLEIDKLNFIYSVNGTDYLASVRSDLGKEA